MVILALPSLYLHMSHVKMENLPGFQRKQLVFKLCCLNRNTIYNKKKYMLPLYSSLGAPTH